MDFRKGPLVGRTRGPASNAARPVGIGRGAVAKRGAECRAGLRARAASRLPTVLFSLLVATSGIAGSATAATKGGETGAPIELATKRFRLGIDADGVCAELVDLRDGRNYLARTRVPFASVTCGGESFDATAVRRDGDRLQVRFGESGVSATLRVREKPDWITFQVVELHEARPVEWLTFLQLRVRLSRRRIAAQLRRVRNERWAVSCQELNLKTHAGLEPIRGDARLFARCCRRFGFQGAAAALLAVPPEEFLDVIESLELAEGLPHPTLDGVWAKRSPAARTSYLFIDMTEQNADEVIRIAKELGFGYVMTYVNCWAKTKGSYEIDLEHYPHGLQGLKEVAEKAHAAGLKVGIHCLNGFIQKGDPLVAPIPDRRMATDGQVTLGADIDADAAFIPTREPPSDFPDDIAYNWQRQGFDVRIDDEIITYRALSTERPFGLLRCIRGARGTRKSPHKKGAIVWHLTQRFQCYLVDCDTDLAQQVAARYAEVINACQLDMIYFDGGFSNIALGEPYRWRYVPQIALQSAALWNREVRVGGAVTGSLYWHLQSFSTCNDYVAMAPKRFLEVNKLRKGRAVLENDLPTDLGWWGLHAWRPHHRATTPDQIEYVCQKALGHGAFWSLETHLDTIRKCGRWPEIKRTIATYERLRRTDYFDESVKRAIREPGAEFKLVGSDEEGWRLVPARYDPPHDVRDEATRTWTVENDLPDQPLRFRLYALPTLDRYGSARNRVLVRHDDPSRYVRSYAHSGCRSRLLPSDRRTPDGECCLVFEAASARADARGWVAHRANLKPVRPGRTGTIGLVGMERDSAEPVPLSRPLGLWVHGDGSGAVLNVQLRAANGGLRDHYIVVDFTGWKYCELARPESDRVFDFPAEYLDKHALARFQYDRLAFLYLRYNAIAPGKQVRCLVGPIKALRENWLPVKDPSFTIGGQTIVFPCQVQTEQYLEFHGRGPARLFDRNGFPLAAVVPTGAVPVLRRGKNRIAFTSAVGPGLSRRVEVVLIRFGD